MGMYCSLRRLRATDLARLIADPASEETYFEESEPSGFGPFADCKIDKAWHGLHFLLTGTAWEGEPPLDFILRGGTELQSDFGYGPARGFTPEEVKAIARALEPIDVAALRKRFDPRTMMKLEIYPTIWDRSPAADDTLGWLAEEYESLRAFIRDAALKQEALLVWTG